MKKNLAFCLCFVFMASGFLACNESSDDNDTRCEAADYPKCDGTELLTCVEGKVVTKNCELGCDAETNLCKTEEVKCEAADYPKCDGNELLTCVEGKVVTKNCRLGCDAETMACIEGELSPIGEECSYDIYKENCYQDDIPLVCIREADEVGILFMYPDGCKAEGLVCGTIIENEITSVDCFEPCDTVDSEREVCLTAGGFPYEWVDKCIGVGQDSNGNPVYGYQNIPGTFYQCVLGCDGTQCKANDALGSDCVEDDYVSQCDENFSLYCHEATVKSEDCGELSCVSGLVNSVNACLESCEAGAPDKGECVEMFGKILVRNYSCQEVGIPKAHYYVGGVDLEECKNSCTDGVCDK